ncbi:hypothetical protein [Burkholderia cenocepacia]|uniref:hypothetical protein n=1 Tax=Burkholderia cenocepacia TaxID=95486 RepID=UPI00209A7D63|nr:hypothetical protein [Burkholderia cenocepacia]
MPLNKDYLQGAYDAFVNSAIQRVARSGDQVYHFNIPANELKDAFGLERLRDETSRKCATSFARKGVDADYEQGEGFDITLDLNRASLKPANARATWRSHLRSKALADRT